MKKIVLLFLFPFSFLFSNAQSECETTRQHIIKSNRITGHIYNDGSLFHDIENEEGGFKFPYTASSSGSTIFGAGLWLGGVDTGGNVKVAASSLYGYESDFTPGPLDPETGMSYSDFPCGFLNNIWTITGEEVISFLKDWNDNQILDLEHDNIFNWPGNGNPYFYPHPLPETEQGWAPFYDRDEDGIYDPLKGDFPSLDYFETGVNFIPNEINWTVFNDNTLHEESGGIPIRMEVQQTTWTRECDSQSEIENTIFVDYKLINRGFEDIDSFHAGIAVDFDIGCYIDDHIGCLPEHNAMIAYITQTDMMATLNVQVNIFLAIFPLSYLLSLLILI